MVKNDSKVELLLFLIMLKYYFILNILSVFAFCTEDLKNIDSLPSWIIESPGYQNPTEVDSIKTGKGFISVKEKGSKGWMIFLNEKAGHGIEIELEKLSLDPNLNEFLLISPWPLIADFRSIKMYTGKFTQPLKKLRIPNTKTFYILFSTSQNSSLPEMVLSYRRYGVSLEVLPPPTDIPVKKETIYEIQLKGKSPEEFSTAEFLGKVKECLRASARRYCAAHKIPFNEEITTQEMVFIRRISFCPFEWPERNICTSVEHSIFVSGVRVPEEEFVLDYQLTADHLKKMWSENNLPELQELGITVFQLPETSNTVLYWSLIIGLMILSSLAGTFVFWKANHVLQNSSRRNSVESFEVKKPKKPKLRLAKHQQVPSFMYKSTMEPQMESVLKTAGEDFRLKETPELSKNEDSSKLPIGNYFGSILFGSNRAFEDEEENPVELRPKTHLK